ncbi:Tex family protein [Myroides sp. LJL110]
MTVIEFIQQTVSASKSSIENTLSLFDESCTIPFIARYRKDKTGNLDEVAIEQIAKFRDLYLQIVKRKQTILASLEQQDSINTLVIEKIAASFDLVEIEDLYLPFKKTRKTKADLAIERGLEPLAKIILSQNCNDIQQVAKNYVKGSLENAQQAIDGACDIIAQWVNENTFIRKVLRSKFDQHAIVETKVIKGQQDLENSKKYQQYFQWEEALHKMPSHRLLAILRAEKEGVLRVGVSIDKHQALEFIFKTIIKQANSSTTSIIQKAIKDSYKRLLEPTLSNETLVQAKLKADLNSIGVFANNLSQLLLQAPLGEKRILAIDPGFKTGCKVVCLDKQGNLLYNETIYPHAPQKEVSMAMKKIRSMVNSYDIQAIAIGNGTASRETEFFIKKIAFDRPVQVFIVNEAGASVYSASRIAREEFANYDVTVRGAVSIGRRLSDPLAELVKIDPKSIGVGQYQHDVDQNLLKQELDTVVIRCVNSVGVNLNTASKSLLSYVSGIGDKLAENIVSYRQENGSFTSREQLKLVPRFGPKAFEQAAAFVRIKDSVNPLDNSAVHPESYWIVEKMAKNLTVPLQELISNKDLIDSIKLHDYIDNKVGIHTLTDIIKELDKPGLDPRKSAKIFEFEPSVKQIGDLKLGQILPGIVNNITNFGCFVDIGIKESGLVHISQLANEFVSDVNQIVKLHQHVKVKVLEVDLGKKRIQLSMIL